MRRHFTFLVCLIAVAGWGIAQEGHFHFAGPLKRFLIEGAAPGVSASGIRFSILISEEGKNLAPTTFELRNNGWEGKIAVSFDGASYSGGQFKASVSLQNESGTVILGVRLDMKEAVEEYETKDEAGKDVLRTRTQAFQFDSPILFGDIPKSAGSDRFDVQVGGLTWNPDTTKITLSFALSGLYLLAPIPQGEMTAPKHIDTDNQGRVYIGDSESGIVWRGDTECKNLEAFCKLSNGVSGMAVDRTTGDVFVTIYNGGKIFRFSSGGEEKDAIEPPVINGEEHLLGFSVRVLRSGSIINGTGTELLKLGQGRVQMHLTKLNGADIGDTKCDEAPNGDLWVLNNETLFRISSDGKKIKQVTFGPDWHLGRLQAPQYCRIDAQGNLYISESDLHPEYARVSVFDPEGRFVRVFGRGGKEPPGENAGVVPGQVFRPSGMAFGKDGRLYILCEPQDGNIGSMFMPF